MHIYIGGPVDAAVGVEQDQGRQALRADFIWKVKRLGHTVHDATAVANNIDLKDMTVVAARYHVLWFERQVALARLCIFDFSTGIPTIGTPVEMQAAFSRHIPVIAILPPGRQSLYALAMANEVVYEWRDALDAIDVVTARG